MSVRCPLKLCLVCDPQDISGPPDVVDPSGFIRIAGGFVETDTGSSPTQSGSEDQGLDSDVEMKDNDSRAISDELDPDTCLSLEQTLRINKIDLPSHTSISQPLDLDEIKQNLDQRRKSTPAPTLEEYLDFCTRTESAVDQTSYLQVLSSMLLRVGGDSPTRQYLAISREQWTETIDNPLTLGLSTPHPDYCEAHRLNLIPPPATKALGSHVQPSACAFAIPRMAVQVDEGHGEVKNPALSSAYNGAVMTYSALRISEYVDQEPQYNKIQAITMTAGRDKIDVHAHSAYMLNDEEYFAATAVAQLSPSVSFEEYERAKYYCWNVQELGFIFSYKTARALKQWHSSDGTEPESDLFPEELSVVQHIHLHHA